ncbi:hypothetical protein Tco_1461846 [Tanacetum coccineum]
MIGGDFALMAHLSSGSSSSSSSDSEVRDNSITDLKNQLAEALRVKNDLKLKLENFETSSMKLTKLINSQISVKTKSGVSFDSQMNENELHDCHLNKSKVFKSAYNSSMNEIEEKNNQVNDRFKKVEVYHTVPPPYTYMPLRPDLSFARLDDFVYKTNVGETITSVPRNETTKSKSSKDSLEQPKYSRNVPVNTAKQSSSRAAVSNSTVRYVNTATSRPTVNGAKPSSNVVHKSHLSVKRTFYQKSAAKTNNFNKKVYTAKVNNVTTAGPEVVVSTAEGKKENAVKSSACWIWRPTGKVIDSGSYMPKRINYVDPQDRPKSVMAWVPKRN